MRKRSAALSVVTITLMFLASVPGLLAQGTPPGTQLGISNIPGVGARAMGMGGAFTAIADDATASTWNPAGLSQLTKPEASLVYDFFQGDSTIGDYESWSYDPYIPLRSEEVWNGDLSFDYNTPTFLSVTYPFRIGERNLVTQFSARRLIEFPDTSLEFEEDFSRFLADGTHTLTEDLSTSGGINTYSLSLASDIVQDRLRLGVTINYLDADFTQDRLSLEVVDVPPGCADLCYTSRDSTQGETTESYSDWFLDLGLQWHLTPKWTFGIVYHTGFSTGWSQSGDGRIDSFFQVTEDSDYNSYPPEVGFALSQSNAQAELTWPDGLAAGIAFRPIDTLTLAVDYTSINWSEGRLDDFSQTISVSGDSTASYTAFNCGSRTVYLSPGETDTCTEDRLSYPSLGSREQPDTSAFRLGAEWVLFSGNKLIPLRIGYFQEEQITATFEDTYYFEFPNSEVDGFTLGAGLGISGQKYGFYFDLAWVHTETTENYDLFNDEGDGYERGFKSKVDLSADRIIASLIFRF